MGTESEGDRVDRNHMQQHVLCFGYDTLSVRTYFSPQDGEVTKEQAATRLASAIHDWRMEDYKKRAFISVKDIHANWGNYEFSLARHLGSNGIGYIEMVDEFAEV